MIKKAKRITNSVKKNKQISKRMDLLGLNVLRKNAVINVFSKSPKVSFKV